MSNNSIKKNQIKNIQNKLAKKIFPYTKSPRISLGRVMDAFIELNPLKNKAWSIS